MLVLIDTVVNAKHENELGRKKVTFHQDNARPHRRTIKIGWPDHVVVYIESWHGK